MSAGVLEQAPAVDLEELVAAEPPPCEVVFILGCTCGRGCPEVERACGKPSVAVVEVICPVHGTNRMWMCQQCVEHASEHAVDIPRVCQCGAPVALRVVSS